MHSSTGVDGLNSGLFSSLAIAENVQSWLIQSHRAQYNIFNAMLHIALTEERRAGEECSYCQAEPLKQHLKILAKPNGAAAWL